MTDIVELLREHGWSVAAEAADEIERMRGALEQIASGHCTLVLAQRIAADALHDVRTESSERCK